jgi:hypothetical protein
MSMTYFTREIFLFLVFLLICFRAEAQQSDSLRVIVEEGWIEEMSGKIAVDVSFKNSFKTFEVASSSGKILLYPNTPNNLRLNISYEFISFGIQFAPEFLPGNGDDDAKGKTKSLQLGTSIVFKHWFSDISYSRVRGYYLRNTADYNDDWSSSDPYIQFPDLNYEGISVSGGYIHNSRFSLRSLTSQTERQLKSAGSFIPVLYLDYYVIDDKSSAINTQKSNNLDISIGPGYAYTFVFNERIYASFGIFGSIGYLDTKLTTRTESGDFVSNQDNLVLRGDGNFGIGYNDSKFYSGFYTSISGAQYQQENTTAINTETRVFYHLFLGMRFNAPKFLEKGIKRIESTF